MNSHSVSMRWVVGVLSFGMLLGMIGGCATESLPKHFASTGQAYPDAASMVPPSDPDTFERSVFPAPYEDVYRAALVSASQVQLNVTFDDKSTGNIFAKRVVQRAPSPSNAGGLGGQAERRYFFAIVVKELGPKKTQVTIMAKAQGRCEPISAWVNVATAGIAAPSRSTANEECLRYSKVHWASGKENQEEQMGQFMTFVRNNLIAAGVY